MSESYIQYPADGSGKKERTLKRTVGANEVHEEVIAVTDGSGTVVDPRSIRALTSSDVVTAEQSDQTKLKATVTQASDVNIGDVSKGTQTHDVKVTLDGETVDVSDRAARDLGKVDIVNPLPAGTNAIGKLAANSGVDIGDVDVTSQPSTLFLHDRKTYKPAVFDASASGNLVAAVSGKVIKLHAMTVQAQGTVVVNLNDGSGGASLMEWSFQAREGAVIPFASAPAYWAKTTANTALYVTLSAAQTVTITAIYSDDDAS